MTVEKAWEILEDMGTSEETLQCVTDIIGYNMEAMKDILYSQYGYNDFEQLEEEYEQ